MRSKLLAIKWILMDVDGVLTDGSITYSSDGTESKTFHVHDGAGIVLAHKAGLKTGIITGRVSGMTERRAQELKMDFFVQGADNKLKVLEDFLDAHLLKAEQVCYIGDDLPDLAVLERVGFSAVPADGRDEVKAICDYVTVAKGGQGSVREVIDKVLKAQGRLQNTINSFK